MSDKKCPVIISTIVQLILSLNFSFMNSQIIFNSGHLNGMIKITISIYDKMIYGSFVLI